MCAVIGALVKKAKPEDFKRIKHMFLESSIRGLHATGISWVKDRKIHTIKHPLPADEFFEKVSLEDKVDSDGSLYLIGHCRYSTSDLDWNQPIADENFSVVHNGVITQEPPEKWESHYGIKCEGKNDTELLFHSRKNGQLTNNPFEVWADSSFAVIEMFTDYHKWINFYRNGKRPLYFTYDEDDWFIYSTKDIGKKVFKTESFETKPGYVYAYHGAQSSYVYAHNEQYFYKKERNWTRTDIRDLQHVNSNN